VSGNTPVIIPTNGIHVPAVKWVTEIQQKSVA
jgi:hypothetical protein